VLVQRNTVAQQGFVARSLVLLVDFAGLQQRNLGFHRRNLLHQRVNVLGLLRICVFLVLIFAACIFLLLVLGGQGGLALELAVSVLFAVIGRDERYVAFSFGSN